MCGIAGIYSRAPFNGQDAMGRALALLRHRGPDETGMHQQGRVCLGHTRLSIIDLSGGHQPIISEDQRHSLVANGEIYNFIELRRELEADGCVFQTHSDSEVIMHAYAALGRDGLRRLHGMFAFALFDSDKGELLLARDRLGIKPLYYAVLPDRFVFASEIKALLPLLPQRPEINPRAVVQFLQNQFNTGEETIFQGIYRLPPGEAMTVDGDLKLHRWRYWSLTDVQPRSLNFDQASEEFDALFEQVMREHVRSDVPYGLFLSGGVDSGIMAGMLKRFQEQPIRSFSVGFADVNMKDELSDAERIASLFGTEHTSLKLNRGRIFRRFVHTVWAADDLMRDYACLPTSILAQEAAKELKVVFTGEGGDEVFAGYGRYRRTPLQQWVKNLLSPGSGGFRTRGQWQPRWSRRLPGPRLREAAAAQREPFIQAWNACPDSWSSIQRYQFIDIQTALADNLLVKVDRMLMSFGLEGRVPFLDHRIVEFGFALPDALKLKSGQGKLFLKRWAERMLPADHLYRKKRGFHVPIGEWLKGDFMRKLADRLPNNPYVAEWFDADAVRDMLNRHIQGKRASREIWCLMQFAIWNRLMFEHQGAEPGVDEDPLEWI